MNPIIWIDTETTGTDTERCAIVQLAALIEVDGGIVSTFSTLINPEDALIQVGAFETNGLSLDALRASPTQIQALSSFINFCRPWGSRYDKRQRFIPAGWNVRFDLDILKASFERHFDKFTFWWHLQYNPIDAMPFVISEWRLGRYGDMPDCRLSSVCERHGIKIEKAHDALADIRATRDLTKVIYNF